MVNSNYAFSLVGSLNVAKNNSMIVPSVAERKLEYSGELKMDPLTTTA
jgi:hypothetical protein